MSEVLHCFNASAWDLISETEQRLIRSLLADSALAAKPTGAGGGMALRYGTIRDFDTSLSTRDPPL
jgi:hypothetical protein